MNPLLPIVLLLTALGLLARRRDLGRAWLVSGLAATAVLAPALLRPAGIPSPSGTLAALAPWQGAVSGETANPELGDVTFQVEPWLLFLRHELRAGRLPFWNPHQSAGAPFWSNGSSAPLFPLHLLFVVLPLQAGFVLLPWLRLVIGGVGAYRLARELGTSGVAAALAAVAFPLSGRFLAFLLYPMGNALCLVPWVFLAVERLARGRRGGWRMLAVTGGLQLLAGHPETAVFSGLSAGLYLLLRGAATPVRAWVGTAAGWATGLALAAAALVPLALTLFATSRWGEWTPGPPPTLAQLLRLWSRFLLPDAAGHPLAGGYRGPFTYAPSSLYVGIAVLALALLAAVRDRGDRRWRALALTVLATFAGACQLPGARHLLHLLPVVRKGLHHYLLLAVMLGLALLAARGLDRWLAGEGRGLGAVATALGLATAGVWTGFLGEWRAHDELPRQLAWTAGVATGLGLLLLGRRLSATARRRLAVVLVALTAGELAWTNGRTNPALDVGELYPPTGAVAFLAGRAGRLAAPGVTFRPNAAMVYGLDDVRGDDSLKLRWFEELYAAELGGGHATFFRPLDRWSSPWLDRLGVRWVIAPPGWRPPVAGWREVYAGDDAVVWERPGAWPLVRWQGDAGAEGLEAVTRSPDRWEVAWRTPRARRVEVATTWARGWSATVDGRPVPVERSGGALVAVGVPAGAGQLVLRYTPAGLLVGAATSLAAALLLAGSWLWSRRDAFRRRGAASAGDGVAGREFAG